MIAKSPVSGVSGMSTRVRSSTLARVTLIDSSIEIAKLLIAGGVGSALAQFVSRSGERRSLRADVRKEISIMEEMRVPVDDPVEDAQRDHALIEARRRLQAAAMIARLPRELIDEYERLVVIARVTSKETLDKTGKSGLPGPVRDCREEAFDLVCDRLWHPRRTARSDAGPGC